MSSKIPVQPGFPCTVIFQFPGYLFPVSKSQHLIITVILINWILQFPVIVRICSIHIHKSLFRKQHDPMPASDALPCGFLLCQSACQFNRIYQIRVIHTVNCCKHPQFLHLAFTLQKQPGTGISITAHLQSVNPCHHSCPYIVVRVDRKKAKFFYPCKCTQTLKQQSSRFNNISISPRSLSSQTTSTRFRFSSFCNVVIAGSNAKNVFSFLS